ncbi:DUF1564 family protein [Leptospira kirschneri]|uniref:DUF1564 family protein n=1 Tax=Leptospira kirschneri TaxID=29507 RepID=UPI0003540B34|nr:DUF1564 family protein [Leptospira kirschneri]EPG51797.1 PF07600 family protein [Leptospira kirschneri serovar Cynopteri str. 3522 CT]
MVKKDQTSSRHIRNLSNEQKNSKLITDKKSILKRNSPSDLWIPRVKIPHLTKRISQFKSLKCMLHFLLKKNRHRLHSPFAHSQKEKTLYQETELELVRFSFRPNAADWAELRLAARYYGVSICNFFVMLLTFDENKGSSKSFWNDFKNRKFQNSEILLIQLISSKRNTLFFSIVTGFNTFHGFERKSSA